MTTMTATQDLGPFLGRLPLEIRNMIYEETFAWKERRLIGYKTAHSFPRRDLLRTNKQIYQEALAVLLQRNRFFHIRTNMVVGLGWLMQGHGVGFLACALSTSTGAKAVLAFKNCVMSISIMAPDDSKIIPTCDIIIVDREDNFECFLDAVARMNGADITLEPVLNPLNISLSLANPYSIPGIAQAVHDRLFHLIKKHWWSMRHFSVHGSERSEITMALQARVRGNRWKDSGDLTRAFMQLYGKADDDCSRAKLALDSMDEHTPLVEMRRVKLDLMTATRTAESANSFLCISLSNDEGLEMPERMSVWEKTNHQVFSLFCHLGMALLALVDLENARGGCQNTSALLDLALMCSDRSCHRAGLQPETLRASEFADLLYLRAHAFRLRGNCMDLHAAANSLERAIEMEAVGDARSAQLEVYDREMKEILEIIEDKFEMLSEEQEVDLRRQIRSLGSRPEEEVSHGLMGYRSFSDEIFLT